MFPHATLPHALTQITENPAIDILGEILWGKREGEVQSAMRGSTRAEVYTKVPITEAFALKLELTSVAAGEEGSRLELGPYRGDARNSGYRLAYEPGRKPAISLLRVAPGRSSVIDFYDQKVELEDGRSHTLEWRRRSDGEMVVLLDEKEIIRTADRGAGGTYDGFNITNAGGDYTVRQIAIFGTEH